MRYPLDAPVPLPSEFTELDPDQQLAWPRDRDRILSLMLLDPQRRCTDWIRRQLEYVEMRDWFRARRGQPLHGPALLYWGHKLGLDPPEYLPWTHEERRLSRREFPEASPWPLSWQESSLHYWQWVWAAEGYRMCYQVAGQWDDLNSTVARCWLLSVLPLTASGDVPWEPGPITTFGSEEQAQRYAAQYDLGGFWDTASAR